MPAESRAPGRPRSRSAGKSPSFSAGYACRPVGGSGPGGPEMGLDPTPGAENAPLPVKSRASAIAVWLLLAGATLRAGGDERPGAGPPAVVRLHERAVLEIRAPLGGRSPQARAQYASEALVHVLE